MVTYGTVAGEMMNRPYAQAKRKLETSGLRPTRQRLSLLRLLLDTAPRHVTAEELFQEARAVPIPVSLATVYNTLHQFTTAGLMTEVVVGSGQSYFDTNPSSHYHYFDKSTGEIIDVPEEEVRFLKLPPAPPGKIIDRIDVVVRIRSIERAGRRLARPEPVGEEA
jgi:Fur family iron response transcriptional regulator